MSETREEKKMEMVVTVGGVDHPMLRAQDLTKREQIEAEHLAGVGMNQAEEKAGLTYVHVLAFMTARRYLPDLTWEQYLDDASIEYEQRETRPPLPGASDESASPAPTPEADGSPASRPSSASNPGTLSTSPKAS